MNVLSVVAVVDSSSLLPRTSWPYASVPAVLARVGVPLVGRVAVDWRPQRGTCITYTIETLLIYSYWIPCEPACETRTAVPTALDVDVGSAIAAVGQLVLHGRRGHDLDAA